MEILPIRILPKNEFFLSNLGNFFLFLLVLNFFWQNNFTQMKKKIGYFGEFVIANSNLEADKNIFV